MLQAGRQQPVRLDLLLRAGEVVVAQLHPGRAGHVGILAGQGQAALLPLRQLVADRDDLRVHQHHRVGLVALLDVHHEQPQQRAHLRRRQADARRLVHGVQHPRREGADGIGIGGADRPGLGPQPRVGHQEDGQQFGMRA